MLSQDNALPWGPKETWKNKHTIQSNHYQLIIDLDMIQYCRQPCPPGRLLLRYYPYNDKVLLVARWLQRQFPEDLNEIYGVEGFVVWGLRPQLNRWLLASLIRWMACSFTKPSAVCLYFIKKKCRDSREFTMIFGVAICINSFLGVCFSLALR